MDECIESAVTAAAVAAVAAAAAVLSEYVPHACMYHVRSGRQCKL